MLGQIDFVRWLRPAPVGAAAARLLGLDKRRVLQTDRGRFLVNPVSHLGYQSARGEYEPGMTSVVTQYLKPGDVFIDLGANEGYFTVIASSLVGDSGAVTAVEPQSRVGATIRTNLAPNGCSNVRVFKSVVSGTTGTARIHPRAATCCRNGQKHGCTHTPERGKAT